MQVNIGEAKTHLSRLVARAEAGEEIIIACAGKPIACLVPYRQSTKPARISGSMKGKIKILPGFDEIDKEIQEAFEGDAELW